MKLTKQQFDLRLKQIKDLAREIFIQNVDIGCKDAVKRAVNFLSDCDKEVNSALSEIIAKRSHDENDSWPTFKKQTNTLLHLAEQFIEAKGDKPIEENTLIEELLDLDWTGIFDQEEWTKEDKEHYMTLLTAYVKDLAKKKKG